MEIVNSAPPITQKDIDSLNEILGFIIPIQYSKFLLSNNGGQPVKNIYKKYSEQNDTLTEISVNNFLGIDKNDIGCDIYRRYILSIANGFKSKEYLPIADDGIGNVICIGINEKIYGKIYVFWHDQPGKKTITLDLVCNTFEEFLNGLSDE
jgi:cell wall assembly regulator SMI1